jgi:glycosyltransferase involved in cell wall biosynthesis
MYEAMAVGTFPIVSPLKTISSVVEAEKHVLFARNLYPEEIAEALTRAMTEDALVDTAAKNNLELVKKVADRAAIRERVIQYYDTLMRQVQKERGNYFPLVTVITPTYNRAPLLVETVNSVLSQDYPNIEYIILDDGSKDNTLELMEQYKGQVIFESHTNIGETRTVNKGFAMATGEYICVVNSDDPILPGSITSLVRALEGDPTALVAYPDWVEIDPASTPIKEMHLPDYDIHSMLKIFNVAMGPGTLFRRSVLEQYGYRDLQRKYTGDLEFWFRLASHGKLAHVPKILATHRTHPQSASVSDKSSKMAEELISMVESLFRDRHLPAELLVQRKKIMSQVYFVGSFYCPDEPLKRLSYRLLAFFYDPQIMVRRRVRMIFSAIRSAGSMILRGIKFLLRITLPQSTYLRIISWWMRLTGQNKQI